MRAQARLARPRGWWWTLGLVAVAAHGADVAAQAAVAAPAPSAPTVAAPALPASALAVEHDAGWREWWRADAAPGRWSAALPALRDAVTWRAGAPGLEWGELRLAGTGEAWRLRVILVRLDPARLRLALQEPVGREGRRGLWSVDSVPADAVLALNAGQFGSRGPWGWVVRAGREQRPPGTGPLAPALVVDGGGRVRLVAPDDIETARRSGEVAEAFQSYPTLLAGDGEVPGPLRVPGRGVDVAHRDSRLAIGELRDGRLLVALTRFEGLGGALSLLPFGPTTPEMAALMGALGCRTAVLLDGGISGQLALREASGELRTWRGLRRVPLALVAVPREAR